MDWMVACGTEKLEIWTENGKDFSPCFSNLVFTLPASFILAVISGYYIGKQCNWVTRKRWELSLLLLRSCLCAGLAVSPALKFYFYQGKRNLYLLDIVSLFTESTAWFVHTIYILVLRQRLSRSLRGPLPTIIGWLLFFSVHTIRLRSYIANYDPLQLNNPIFWCDVVVGILQVVFLLSLLPQGFADPANPDETFISIRDDEFSRRASTYGQYSLDANHSYLGVAREGTSLLSRLFFSWVRPLMEKGNQETLNHLDDLFDLAHNSTSHYLRTHIMQELSVNSSLVRALHRCFGKQFYLLGILKFASDSLVFVGPLLLGVLVQFIDDKTEPILFGYLCAAALCLSSFVGSLTSSHFNFGVAEISLRMRASLVAAVFTKTLSMSFAEMAKFNSGEIVNMMSTDADRIVNFCQSFHALWSLPFQIGIALFLLYRQVGIAFIGGVVFAVMLIPINRIIAVQIGKLSNEMMQAKDQRVKCMHEALQGMRVIKYYAWEDHFERKINEYREREMNALKRRKYLDAVCVYFWATTPVLVAIITFATYVAVGGKLTAAKVFTSLALFNMLITPLNAFPWVVNGIVEAWISLKRVQKLVEVPNMKPDVYYSKESRADSDSAIQVNNAELSWQSPDTSSGIFKLTDLNIKIKPGQFVGIVGKVGSGKTTLLNAVAGELVKIGGEVFVSNYPQGFSVATQEPWILHGTIRENILFGKAFDATKYKRVTEACALSPDFQQLQSGDQTLVGDNGLMLSGGQKARVALARAVYQEKDIFLLDDVLAAVDQHVAEHLVSHVVLDLLKNKTRILCTHHVRYLQAADWVIVLEEGRILMQGPPKEILPQCRDTGFFSSGEHSKPKSSLADEEAESAPNIIPEEERCTGAVKFGVVASYWNAVGSSLAAAVLGSLLLMQSSRNVSDWWLARWVSDTADNSSTNARLVEDDTNYYMGVYGGIVASNSLFTFFRAFLFAYGGLKAAKNIHTQLLSTILKAKITFFDITPLGRIINRFSSDVYAIDDALPFMLNIFLAQTFALAGTIVMTCVGIPWILLLLLPLGFVYFGLQQFYRKTSRELKRLNTVTLSPMYSHFAETLAGLLTIRATRSSSRFIQDNEDLVENNTKTQFAGQAAAQWLSLRLQLIGVTMITAVGIFAVLQHHFHTVDPGLVGLAISYALSITNVLSGVVTSFVETEKEMVSVERAEQYIERVSSENSLARVSPPHNWPSKGVIVFKNVCLKYREHLPLALKDISFATAPAEKIGIVGRTGSGKSSLLQVLFRLIDMSNGDVTIDDISIRLLSTKELRSKMSIIPQDPFLFSGSVRENLDPTSRFQDSELWTALRRCHLAEAVNKCGGLDTDVLERGRLFSAGQKQLLCLARALLLNAKILCIDEATANVDCETDRLVQETIRLAFRNSTVLTIAHRIETVMDSDRVLIMSNGEVVEFETPERLLSNQASHFFKLVNHLK